MADPLLDVANLPLEDVGPLTPEKWARIESYLEDWKRDVLAAAAAHPARSFELGRAQVDAFAELLGRLRSETTPFGGEGESLRQTVTWSKTYLMRELEDALNAYVGKIKDELLYGLRLQLNPTQVASRLYNATHDAGVNWRMIARTEMVRANAMGRLAAARRMGFDRVWVPPHAGACKQCRRLLENKVFLIADVERASNFGTKDPAEWVPCIPLHPHCRHGYLPYDEEVYGEAMRQYGRMAEAGLMDDDNLDEWFDSSGQLKPEYAGIDFSAAKSLVGREYADSRILDPWVEGLAAVVHKRRDKLFQGGRTARREHVPLERLQVASYQREIDWLKVGAYARQLRQGDDDVQAADVAERGDGSLWVTDGQHRLLAAQRVGEPTLLCNITPSMGWAEEADRCRELMKAIADPLITTAAPLAVPMTRVLAPEPPALAEQLDATVWDRLGPRREVLDQLETWWCRTVTPEVAAATRLYLTPWPDTVHIAVDWHALRAARPAWRKLADGDMHAVLVAMALAAARNTELAPGIPLTIAVRPEHSIEAFERGLGAAGLQAWSVDGTGFVGCHGGSLDVAAALRARTEKSIDLAALWPDYVLKTTTPENLDSGGRNPSFKPVSLITGWHVAPAAARESILEHGLIEAQPNDRWSRYGAATEPAGVYVWTDRARALKWAADMAELVGQSELARNDVWRVDLTGLPVERDPVLGDQGASYVALPGIPPSRLHVEVTKTRAEFDLDVAKSPAVAAAPNSGVEHWITVHPHGEEEPGQAVLVRNNADGTMSVMGGAGGNLNGLRLDPKRRIDREKGQKAKGAKHEVEQQMTDEEARAHELSRQKDVETATAALEKATAARAEVMSNLHAYLHDELGLDVNADELDGKGRAKLMAKVRTAALRTLAYGPLQTRDRSDGADAGELDLRAPDAPKPWLPDDETDEGTDSSSPATEPVSPGPDDDETPARPPRPQVALTEDQAAAILDQLGRARQFSKIAGAQRRVIKGDQTASDANQIDWSLGGQDAAEERRAKQVDQTVRTDNMRQLLDGADDFWLGSKRGYNTHYARAFRQGAYDSIDAFTSAITGHGVMSKDAADLLGVAGAAQLVGHVLQQEAAKGAVDLEKVGAALSKLTDEQEAAVTSRGLARVHAAADRAVEAQRELVDSEAGRSLYTTTMARSLASKKLQEARRGLGMMVGGLEATSALKVALERAQGEKIKVGFASPAAAKKAAEKARVKITDRDIKKVGPGNYVLSLDPERLTGLVKPQDVGDEVMRKRLEKIRTGKGLEDAIEAARTGPGMGQVLDANQARGKLFLRAAKSGVLAFDPGVGKTHTALAAIEEERAANPGKRHQALIVVPAAVAGEWQRTIQMQGAGRTVAMVDGSTKAKQAALAGDADYTIVSYESLKSPAMQEALRGREQAHSIVVADELQKGKNPNTGNHGAVENAVRRAREDHGDDSHFYGLSGTPIEKDVGDLHSMVKLAQIAKGQQPSDFKSYRRRYGKLGQDEHIARGDKIAQFRQSLDEDLFRLTAHDAGNGLPEPARQTHQVTLDPDHQAALQAKVKQLNERIADYHAAVKEGRSARMPEFGGRTELLDTLYGRENSALSRKAADLVEQLSSQTFKHKGGSYTLPDGSPDPDNHAGTYQHKTVVFGASESSRALFGPEWTKRQGSKKGGLHAELERRGVHVFVGNGDISNEENQSNYRAFLAHQGPAVFLTNDKNNAGISLQFGANKGVFQHGATHMIHFTRPVNNATIQQREARILRKGSQAKTTYHVLSAGTPMERRLQDTLEEEARTQDLAANSEQRVAGRDTLRSTLRRTRATRAHDRADDAPAPAASAQEAA